MQQLQQSQSLRERTENKYSISFHSVIFSTVTADTIMFTKCQVLHDIARIVVTMDLK